MVDMLSKSTALCIKTDSNDEKPDNAGDEKVFSG